MAINKATPMRFTPRGLVDAFDATDKFPGACQKLVNLIFDQSNPELAVSRPGVVTLVDFALHGYASPTFISIQAAIGTRIYGMIATQRNPGNDEPFVYDTATNAFVIISGITGANTPTSPTTTGDWIPPTISNVGTMIIITHPGFDGTGTRFYGVIDITNAAAPSWRSENVAVNPLPAVPLAVANFNNRPWFAVANKLYDCDVLTNPVTRTNATQQLTIGDTGLITTLSGLPIQTTSSGVLQTLTVFKSTQVWQVSGDRATNNLAQNYVSLTVGCNAPRTVAQSPFGLYFSSTGGPYFLDLLGTVRPLGHNIQDQLADIQAPFENALTPTRWAGAYNSSVYRVCGPTIVRGIQSINDYWFDEHKRRWNGPHTFFYDCASALAGYFVLSSSIFPGKLIQSTTQQSINFVNTDLGTVMRTKLLSSTFPKVSDMLMKQVAESQIELAASAGNIVYTITAQDEQGNSLGTAQIAVTSFGKPWGGFVWGDGTLWASSPFWGGGALWGAPVQYWGSVASGGSGDLWGAKCIHWTQAGGSGAIWGAGVQNIPATYPVPWQAPLVFEKMQLLIETQASAEVAIGTFYARYQKTGYMTLGPSGEKPC